MQNKESYLSRQEIEKRLIDKVLPVDLNRIISAYEMAENAHTNHRDQDGIPIFFHVTRVCRILIDELQIYDADLLIASLLHDIYQTSNEINHEIITYNFGAYVAFLIDDMPDKFSYDNFDKINVDSFIIENIRVPFDDYYIIRLSQHLDDMRTIEFHPSVNPINFVNDIAARYMDITSKTDNPNIKYLVDEMKKERNKFLC